MKASLAFIAAFLVLLVVPIAFAQPAGTSIDKVTVRLYEEGDGLRVQETHDLTVNDAAAFRANPVLRASLESGTPKPDAILVRGVANQSIAEDRVVAVSGAAGWQTFTVNLTGLVDNVTNGARVSVQLEYSHPDRLFRGRVEYPAASLVVYATPGSGRQVASSELGAFNPTLNGNEQHATRSAAPAGFAYTVDFARAGAPAAARDLNPYVYGLLGLVAGFVLAWFVFKRKPKAKKFEKGGEMESGAMLEARRRTLMAALKELELAHEAKEIPDAAYAPLKEEYKAQTVRVLRSIEEKKETPGTKP